MFDAPAIRRSTSPTARRGMATLLVLSLIAMTLALSYAMVRTQASSVKSQANAALRADARQAALTGLSTALRRMSQSNWSGADTNFAASLSSTLRFSVGFTTGDALLPTSGAEAADWPYRVTILSTGYATDPSASTVTTTYQVQAVVKLVPRQLAAAPSTWTTASSYVLYQTAAEDVSVQPPVRIDGPVRLQRGLVFAETYPTPSHAKTQFMADLNAMRSDGYADYRPFSGPLQMPLNRTDGSTRNLLTDRLGLTLIDDSGANASGWSHPGNVTAYRLYSGGAAYQPATLGANVSGTSLTADPRTNPLGLFVCNGDVTIGAGTTVRGTILAVGKVTINGAGVDLAPYSLPALDGTSSAVQLPAVICGGDLRVNDGAVATIRGAVAVFQEFSLSTGTQATTLDLRGRVLTRKLLVSPRSEWNVGSFWWSLLWYWFGNQSGSIQIRYFPAYLQAVAGMNYAPLLTIGPPADTATYQWFRSDSPVYVAHAADPGLRWTLLRIKELP